MIPLALLALGLLVQFAPWPPALVERLYLGLLYPAWSAVSSVVVDGFGPSLSALLALLLVALPLVGWLGGGRGACRGAVRTWWWSAGVLAILFPLTFGLAYRLPPVEQVVALENGALDAAARTAVADEVARRLSESARSGRMDPGALGDRSALAAASRCVAATAAELRGGGPPRLPERIKRLPPGLLLRFGFAGVVSPWLLEPHVDAGLPPASALAVALHEFAHTAAFAPEAEAEAVALLAGLTCGDERVRYAAALRLASSLAAAMPAEEARAYRAAWPEHAVRDARAAALAALGFRSGALAPRLEAVYDLYLRSQGGEAGIREYDRGTDLAVRLLLQRLPELR